MSLLQRYFKTKVSLQKIQQQNTLVPSYPEVRPLFDNTLLKISSRTSTFWSWDFLIQSWTKLWTKNCQSLLHLKQKMYWALILFFIPKLSCLQALRIQNESKENFWAFFCMLPSKLRGKANETGETGNHCPETMLKILQIFRDTGWQNHFQEKQLQQEEMHFDGKAQKFV